MMKRGNMLRAVCLGAIVAVLSACGGGKLEVISHQEYLGPHGERVSDTVYRGHGSKRADRTVDVTYPNGVQLRIVDVGNDHHGDNFYFPRFRKYQQPAYIEPIIPPAGKTVMTRISPAGKTVMVLPDEETLEQQYLR